MNKYFYIKMAVGNLKRNREIYFPYLLASGLMITVYYIFLLIAGNDGMQNIPHSETLKMIMSIGVWVGAIFSVIFIFYANSFLMKQRKKEFGLYGILGLERRHVARVMLYETGISAMGAIGGGIIFGTIFAKLAFLILLKLIHVTQGSQLNIAPTAIVKTIIVFLIIFMVVGLFNVFQVSLSHPVELMRSRQKGEKVPKGSIILALLGVICLGVGYYLALTMKSGELEFGQSFAAILAVMIGTYCVFIAGSIKILRMLKRSKKIYYRPDNFVSISGLMYRLRKNAVGLASICIICTMILITLSATISMQIGGMDSVRKSVGVDLYVGNIPTKAYETLLLDGLEELAPVYDITIERCDVFPDKQMNYYYVGDGNLVSCYGGMTMLEDKVLWEDGSGQTHEFYGEPYFFNIVLISADDYERMTGTALDIGENHGVVVCDRENKWNDDHREILLSQKSWHFNGNNAARGPEEDNRTPWIEKNIEIDDVIYDSVFIDDKYVKDDRIYLILSDARTVNDMDNGYVGSDYTRAKIEFSGSSENRSAFIAAVKAPLDATGYGSSFSSVDELMEAFYVGYGGLVFVGVLLSMIFLLAMVLIIYYKQMSEGMEDRERYQILIKVGIDEGDVKKTISKQVKTLFFVPLVAAIVHTAAAFKLTSNILAFVMYRNYALFACCTLAAIGLVILVYVAVYGITARSYYKRIH